MGIALVVDDNPDLRLLFRSILEREGFRVQLAANGQEAQAKLIEHKTFSFILLDLMMPGMSGYDFLKWKNNLPQFENVPVIVLSAAPPEHHLPGVAQYMRKPIDMNQMIETISHFRPVEATT